MQENRDLQPIYVQKADMAVSQLTSGGALLREQDKRFILVAIKKAAILPLVRVTQMSRNEREIPKMTTFGSQVWFPATEMEELALGQRVRPAFDKVTITTHEIMCQVNFPRYFLKSQVEGPAFQNTLIAYLGAHGTRDWDNFVLNGDTTSANTLLALADGMIKLMTTNTYPAGGGSLSSDILDRTMQTMPEEYSNQDGLGFFTCRGARAAYRRELQARGTQLGDVNITGQNVQYDGIPITVVPMMPTTLGLGGNQTVLLHLNPKQFVLGVEEAIEMTTEYFRGARMWSVIMTARIGQNFEHEPATVKTTGLLAS